MKEFKYLHSGKRVNRVMKDIERYNEIAVGIEDKLLEMQELGKRVDEFIVPEVDMLLKIDTKENVSQYVFANDIEEKTIYTTTEEGFIETKKEVEVMRIGREVQYTIVQDGIMAVGREEMRSVKPSTFNTEYVRAVNIAKHKAYVNLHNIFINSFKED